MTAAIQRPSAADRTFCSERIDALIADVCRDIRDPVLAQLFTYCLPNTLDTAVAFSERPDGTPDTFIVSGNIPAMWIRDSVCQVWPYIEFIRDEPALERMIEGVIRRHVRNILLDPYANAFMREQTDVRENYAARPALKPGIWCRRYQLDSFGFIMRLSHAYWKAGGNPACFDGDWLRAVRSLTDIIRLLQAGTDELPHPEFRFERLSYDPCESLPLAGFGPPCRRCGLTRTAFRPSDDAAVFPFHVPANALAVVGLRQLAEMLAAFGSDPALAAESRTLAGEINSALEQHAVADHPVVGTIRAYEMDGFGSTLLMDDANYPNLLSLPYLGFCGADDPLYLRTRRFVLGPHNPYWASGREAAGLGGPHCFAVYAGEGQIREGLGVIWPLGIAMQAMTSLDDAEIQACLAQLVRIGARFGFMPEAVWKDDLSYFRRKWFCWANVLFGELVLHLHRTQPGLLAEFSSRA